MQVRIDRVVRDGCEEEKTKLMVQKEGSPSVCQLVYALTQLSAYCLGLGGFVCDSLVGCGEQTAGPQSLLRCSPTDGKDAGSRV